MNEALNLMGEGDDLAAWLGDDVAQTAPLMRELLVRQRVLPQALSPDEFAMVKRVVDGVHQWRLAHVVTLVEAEGVPAAVKPPTQAVIDERRVARETVMASIPKETYGMALDELGLSARVTQHIAAAGISSIGQLLEHSTRGDEGLLAIPNVGSKALGEIKQALEKVVGKAALPATPVPEAAPETPVAAAAAPEVVAPVAPVPAPVAVVAETPEEASQLFMNAVGVEVPGASDGDDAPAADADARLPRGKKDKRGKERLLVYDEELGRMVPARTHFRGDEPDEIE